MLSALRVDSIAADLELVKSSCQRSKDVAKIEPEQKDTILPMNSAVREKSIIRKSMNASDHTIRKSMPREFSAAIVLLEPLRAKIDG